ncbi:hypothetical protein [Pseudomonas panipatensis]|jgi:hypothetical protein|uniref:Uncharacterized protein n=1 Tax=Pseudomonas panipatensis TaxID=428992 RepID=A0A1G8BWY0_9PSED|nr:hypothetical protein [Pseudomonas panipatensis]SDH37737.1 hypothetical protein SAMN05216272_101274 [Pseudomonas panipatensis]SMP66937.1 hypothetical protein SAMN06295951_107242 [Pseudomonas panipatensis]
MNAEGLQRNFTARDRARPLRSLCARLLALGTLLLLCAGGAEAGRELPSGMLVGVVDSAQFPVITLKRPKPGLLTRIITLWMYDGTISYPVAPSVRIRNQNNLFVVSGLMPQLKDKFVALKSGLNGEVNQIWVLSEAEAEEYITRPGTLFPPVATLSGSSASTSSSTSE